MAAGSLAGYRRKRPWALATRGARWLAALGSGLAVIGLAGCAAAAPAAPASGGPGASCGQTRTAAGVPVTIQVVRGTVSCTAALRVETAYAAAIKAGGLRGTGGGAPLQVDGWTCESYSTTQALRSRRASACHTANAEVVAVLSLSPGSPPAVAAPAVAAPAVAAPVAAAPAVAAGN